jgi:diguanylate cyclase (GGDEF)-like protein
MGLLIAAYAASLLLRGDGQSWPVVDGWLVDAFELLAGVMCLGRGLRRRPGRGIPLVLGAGMVSWATGDLLNTIQSLGGAAPPAPSLSDVFFLGFFPLTYVAVVLLLRRDIKRLLPGTWLDGLIAGLGAAAVCAAFAFHAILHSVGGNVLAVAANLAYPIGDVLLLALVVGGTAILPGRPRPQWLLLATACAVNAAGDTFNLFQSSVGASRAGSIINAIAWPVSLLLISMSVWLRPGRRNLLAPHKAPGFLLPGLGAASGLGILLFDTIRQVDQVALALAAATLVTVGVRFTLSVRGLRAITEERHRQAVTDDLTGLGNRRQLFDLLNAFFTDHADPHTHGRHLAFLFIDLNHFKEVNDSFGHSAGDELLRQLGPRLTRLLRASDLLVRIGGDELGAVLMDTDPRDASAIAHRLAAELEEPFVLDGVSVRISASIGMAIAPIDATDSAGVMRCADVAMYRAKLGGSSFEAYQRDIDDDGNRMRLVEELREAVDEGHLVLHYQTQLDLGTGEVSAVEALLRWPHPRLGMVPPLDFLPLAEEAGLMRPLTALVLHRALAQSSEWWDSGRGLPVSINVSASNLLDPDFVDDVRNALARHRLPASALTLEITETTIIGDFTRARDVITALRRIGVGVAIDDFGAGFTSLAHLAGLEVNELKLDCTLVSVLATGSARELALVQATVELGHALGLRVVAEGVEDRATLGLLAGFGCDLAQGCFIGRPVPAGELTLHPDFARTGTADATLAS